MTVAIVDDEAGVREAVSFALEEAGYSVVSFRDGADAWAAWHESLPDLVVLDIIMPRLDGLELCRRIRMRCRELPVIFLTSKDEEIDRVVGLELGADDYLCKPFSVRELVARVRALERRLRYTRSGDYARLVGVAAADGGGGGAEAHGGERYGPEGTAVRGVGSAAASAPGGARGDSGLRLDPDAIRVWWHGRLVPLTVTEFRLMEVLVRRHGAVLTREQLLRAAYPDDVYVTERSIDSHIRRIRKKFEETGTPLRALSAVYGAGYRYQEPLGE